MHTARAQPALRRLDLGDAPVDGDDRGAPAEGLERVPALTAAQVEHGHAGLQVEQVVVDGQHRLFLFARLTGLIRINGILLAQWHLCCHSCSLLVIRHSVSVTRHLSLGIRHETPLQA